MPDATVGGEFRYELPLDVRFRDTDAMGHVNNAVYLTYFEAARAGYYRAVTGRSFTGIDEEPVSIILARASVDFRAQAYFGEQLLVGCRTSWVGRSSFALAYRIVAAPDSTRGAGRLIAEGETILVTFDYAKQRPVQIPAELAARLAAFEGAPIPPRPGRPSGARPPSA
ncbi:MAG: acyl-CoA thioesterase [Candidatus Limnocylindrales bacterium]